MVLEELSSKRIVGINQIEVTVRDAGQGMLQK